MIEDHYQTSKNANWRMYNISQPIDGIMLLPYLYNSHWYLLVLDITNNTILHLDPQVITSNDKRRAINAFKSYTKDCSIVDTAGVRFCDKPWREITCNKRPFQSDIFNCGVYIIYYISCIIRKESIDKNFKPTDFRYVVAETLLRTSESMKEVCQYCFSDRNIPLVMCNTCRRWVHQQCLKRKFNMKTDWKDPHSKYRCLLCSNGFRPWMQYSK